MGNADVEFVIAVVNEVKRSGGGFTKDLLRNCYMADLNQKGVNEPPTVSEKWIDYYWARLNSISFDRIEKAASSAQRLSKLLIEVLGK